MPKGCLIRGSPGDGLGDNKRHSFHSIRLRLPGDVAFSLFITPVNLTTDMSNYGLSQSVLVIMRTRYAVTVR